MVNLWSLDTLHAGGMKGRRHERKVAPGGAERHPAFISRAAFAPRPGCEHLRYGNPGLRSLRSPNPGLNSQHASGVLPGSIAYRSSAARGHIDVVYSRSMKATTIKLDGLILQELMAFKRPDQNLTALVRELLKAQIHRSKMAQAAEEYAAFLRENREESGELDAWASASLDRDPAVRRPKKRS